MAFAFAGQWGPEPVVDRYGNAIYSATFRVLTTTGAEATVYTDRTKATTVSQPLDVDGEANATFYAAPGRYTVELTAGGSVTSFPVGVVPDAEDVEPAGDVATQFAATAWRTGEFVHDVTHPDYGAVGDGVTDDTAAIQAAIDAAAVSGGVVAFPGGKTYAHTSQLQWKLGADLVAIGRGTGTVPSQLVRLWYTGAALAGGAVKVVRGAATNYPFLHAERIQFNANELANYCVEFETGAKVDFETSFPGCQFAASVSHAIYIPGGVTNLHLTDVRWDGCVGFGVYVGMPCDFANIDRFTWDNASGSGGAAGLLHLDNTGAPNNAIARARIANGRIEVNASVTNAMILCTQTGVASQGIEHRIELDNLYCPTATGFGAYSFIKVTPTGNDFIQVTAKQFEAASATTMLEGTRTPGPALADGRRLSLWTFDPHLAVTAERGQVLLQSLHPTPAIRPSTALFYTSHGGASTDVRPANERLIATPFYIPVACTLTTLGVNVTGAGDVGYVIRLGFYKDNVGTPGDLVVDAGTVAGDAVGAPTLSVSQRLTAGWYWLASVAQGSGTAPFVRHLVGPIYGMGHETINATDACGYARSAVSGALPSPFAGSFVQHTNAPRVHAKVSYP